MISFLEKTWTDSVAHPVRNENKLFSWENWFSRLKRAIHYYSSLIEWKAVDKCYVSSPLEQAKFKHKTNTEAETRTRGEVNSFYLQSNRLFLALPQSLWLGDQVIIHFQKYIIRLLLLYFWINRGFTTTCVSFMIRLSLPTSLVVSWLNIKDIFVSCQWQEEEDTHNVIKLNCFQRKKDTQ